MPTDRKSVKFSRETYERAQECKRDGETWDAFLDRAMDALEADAPSWDPPDDVLTAAHIDDIAAATAHLAADEIETRLR